MKTLLQIDEELEGLEMFLEDAREDIRTKLEEIWFQKKVIKIHENSILRIEKRIIRAERKQEELTDKRKAIEEKTKEVKE